MATKTKKTPDKKLRVDGGRRKVPFKQSKMYGNRYIYLMIWITIIYFLVFRYWPITWNAIAFQDFKILRGFADSEWVGFRNFERIFSNMTYFGRLLRNTFALNALSLLFAFPAPIIFALLLNELWFKRFKSITQTISYLPYFISTVVVVGMTRQLLSPSLGLINNVMVQLGGSRINFLSEPRYFYAIMVITGIWQGIGWGSIIYLATLSNIDPHLYEAAEIDGANRWQQTIHITIPGIRNMIMLMLILQIGSLMAVNTEKIYLFQNDINLTVSEMFPTYTYKTGLISQEYSRATAAGVFSSIISIVLVSIANWISKKYTDIAIM